MRDSGEHAGCARVVSLSNPNCRTSAENNKSPHTIASSGGGAMGILVKRKRLRACTMGRRVAVAGLKRPAAVLLCSLCRAAAYTCGVQFALVPCLDVPGKNLAHRDRQLL